MINCFPGLCSVAFHTSTSLEDVRQWLKAELNFFRIHLLFFLFTPLISAGIFYAANGQFQIRECLGHDSSLATCDSQRFIVAFIDALFLCYSALTVTGLSTVNLSTLTVFQQAILYVLMGVGNVVCIVLYNVALKAL
jgi:hypothetical protein